MLIFLQSFAVWLAAVRADLYTITAVMAMAWAASEVVVGYPDQPVRALRTWGAWLLMAANAFFACLALAASLALIPNSASVWLALGVGLSWQAMLRGGINIQPLPISSSASAAEGMGVPLNELYARLQGFCVGQIQRYLVGERVALMERVITQLDVADLARIARLVTAALGDATPEVEQYIRRLETDENRSQEQREIMLISLILSNRGSDILRKRVKEQRQGQ
jgi:hypothetical protein